MKKVTLIAAVFVVMLMAGCGAQKNELDQGYALFKAGDCAGAAPYLDTTIAAPDDLMDLAYAYFIKGKCAEKSGDAAAAYENFYAAKVVTCYSVAHDTHVNLNTYARSEYCQKRLPEMLEKLAPSVGKDKVEAIRAKVDTKLHARYMDRFVKK